MELEEEVKKTSEEKEVSETKKREEVSETEEKEEVSETEEKEEVSETKKKEVSETEEKEEVSETEEKEEVCETEEKEEVSEAEEEEEVRLASGDSSIINQEHNIIQEKLETLKTIDSLHIYRGFRRTYLASFHSKDFHILNNEGQELWIAEDASNLKCCCGTFKVNIKDLSNRQIILLKSGFHCCLEKLEVYISDSLFIGTAKDIFSIVIPKFSVLDKHGTKLFKIKQKGLCGANLITKLSDNEVIGNIKIIYNNMYSYEAKHAMSIRFPLNLEVDKKALLIGASFLIGLETFLS